MYLNVFFITNVIYKNKFKNKCYTIQQYKRKCYTIQQYKKVVMYIQKLHHFCNTFYPDDGPRLGRKYLGKITNYRRFINQSHWISSIWQFERINKKICRQKMTIMLNQIYIYIYISIVPIIDRIMYHSALPFVFGYVIMALC